MKIVSYSNLPILQNYKEIIKFLIKFPSVINGFATQFCLKQISDKVKCQAIVKKLYKFLTIDDLETMKINQQNYLEVKQSSFLTVCFFCLKDITSIADLKNSRTKGCLYKIWSRSQCHHFVDNEYYCNNCITLNNSIDNDTTER